MSLRSFLHVAVCASAVAGAGLAQLDVASAKTTRVADGFELEQIYAVPPEQGSWISLCSDDRHRLIACDQRGGLYRIDLEARSVEVEPLDVDVGGAQGLCFSRGSLYANGRRGDDTGLFRLTDTDGDDRFDRVEHLIHIKVGSEHGAHAIVEGPDGELYVCAGNMAHYPKPNFTHSRVPRVMAGDHLIDRLPDAGGHNNGAPPIGGWIMRVSHDGSRRELFASGFRNHYDLAFDANGEMFTFDSDMEWDIGTPWYRPTRILHVTSGAEFGWRFGSGKWPTHYTDSLGSVLDVGPGSPAGLVFGTHAKFPARYQRALFAADWSYGILYAIHLEPDGSSFRGTKEVVATAAPLPINDLVVSKADGALYFTTGGRGATSGLFRLRYVGSEPTEPIRAEPTDSTPNRLLGTIEDLHEPTTDHDLDHQWPRIAILQDLIRRHLTDADHRVRFSARIALEFMPPRSWRERFFPGDGFGVEENPRALAQAAIALARHGESDDGPKLLKLLARALGDEISNEIRLELLRACSVVIARLAPRDTTELVRALDASFPSRTRLVDLETFRVLAGIDAPGIVGRGLDALDAALSQEDQMHYAYCLRVVTNGWTDELRTRYFAWFERAARFRGGSSFRGFCNAIRKDAIERMPADAKERLATVLEQEPELAPVAAVDARREFVHAWTVDELLPKLREKTRRHDFERGRRMFAEAACLRCHRFAGDGGSVGPDLTAVGRRFGLREILEATLEPSQVISDQYQPTIFELSNGDVIAGYVANYKHDNTIEIVQNMLAPSELTKIKADDIVSREPSPVSMMPPGLLWTLDLDEVRDLVAYMRSGGDPSHALFRD